MKRLRLLPLTVTCLASAVVVQGADVTSPAIMPSFEPTMTTSPATSSISSTPTGTPSISISNNPTQTGEPSSSMNPTSPSSEPSMNPTAPTMEPSLTPTDVPSVMPSVPPSLSVKPSATQLPSVAPSVTPSMFPTETTRPTPSPSGAPTFGPSSSLRPSDTPSYSLRPSTTSSPSSEPSKVPSIAPSKFPTSAPSFFPPTPSPSMLPTPIPTTGFPSEGPTPSPSIPMMNVTRTEIVMVFAGLPVLDTDRNRTVWEQTTSEHVSTYWEERELPGVEVTEVETEILRIVEVNGENRLQQDDSEVLRSYYYEQRIQFGCADNDCNIKGNNNALFTRPFNLDETRYANTLVENLVGLDPEVDEIFVNSVEVISGTPAPAIVPPIEGPTAPSPSPKTDSTAKIVIPVLLVAVFIGAASLLFLNYSNRQRQRAKKFSEGNNAALSMDEGDLDGDFQVDTDFPAQIHTPGDASNVFDNGSEIEPYSMTSGSLHLMGGMGSDYGDTDTLLNRDESDAEALFDDDMVDGDINPLARNSSFDSSVDDPPSMSGFNVQVTDLDGDEEIPGDAFDGVATESPLLE